MQLFVRGTKTHTLQIAGEETVQDVKTFLNGTEGFPCEEQVILYAGKPLSDNVKLISFDDLATLDCDVRMLGGKVHGSLARAGKVKGQTPKVDKQEKKKAKTGRAKRRMQYNRRFGVTVATFGRRKGPNANS
ncbi:ubiquitin-like protein FUBI [Mizuhopecten yessoensis]|uniref:40S ribosomal protein S30 n=1 Tax=Mizuhopecten yessoensis TaxID=6573 RepID=A0A210PFB2_MIZYE|nr:ubiquitin-like protein FUBI [Mizuhopecten yessoensis]XP_021343070.1 ubiquitin-like protein FUBI [Mizuhopecten yessoensis]OWF35172.1 40S ribosomal protein S30 [Mizuhopecten yessoensis]